MNKKIALLFNLLIFLPVIIYAETYWGGELPNIRNTQLKAEVSLVGDVYTYSYTVTSGSTNTGQIWSFDIDIRQPQGSLELSGEGLVNGPGYLKHTSAQVLSEPTTPKMIPVGLFSPSNWNSGPDILGQVGWGADDDQDMIYPGRSLGGFQITSRGLPGIRDFRIEPDLIPPSEESDITIEQIQEVEDKVAFKGKTIGPTAPPANFKPIDFLNYIIDLKHQSVSLGWIKNEGIENSLDAKMENAGKKIEAGDTKTAKNILNAFINEVEAQGCETYEKCPEGKHLTPEAYALLKYNVRYLIEQLK
ncbi:MAG: hypothetical protein Fur0020_05280 [Thermodesulfovibrionia bacterium]